jgi:hypothetical protein
MAFDIDRPVLDSMVEWAEKKSNPQVATLIADIRALLRRLVALQDLRNRVLHHVDGISAEMIEKALPSCGVEFPAIGAALVAQLSLLETSLNRETDFFLPEQVYREVNDVILRELSGIQM